MKVTISKNHRPKSGKPVQFREWKIETEEAIEGTENSFGSFDSMGSNIKVIDGSFSELKPMVSQKPKDSENVPGSSHASAPGPSTVNFTRDFKPSVTSTPAVNMYENVSDPESENLEDINITFDPEDETKKKQSYEKSIGELVDFITQQPPGSINAPAPGPSTFNFTRNFKPSVTSTRAINMYENVSDPESENLEDINITFDLQDEITEIQSCEEYVDELAEFINKTQNMVKAKIAKRTVLLKKLKKYQKKGKKLESLINAMDRLITFGSKMPELLKNF